MIEIMLLGMLVKKGTGLAGDGGTGKNNRCTGHT